MRPVLLFPGQGAQSVGMAKELCEKYPESKEVFNDASEVLGFDLAQVCFEGPAEKLVPTEVTQPAVMAASLAAWAPLESKAGEPKAALGHSLGEVTAWVACGMVDRKTGFEIVRIRAKAMAAAGAKNPGAMAAVLGLPENEVARILSAFSPDEVLGANWNSEDQVVLAGKPEAVEEAGKKLKEAGAKRVIPLKVSAAFHTPQLSGAAEVLGELLDSLLDQGRIKAPRCPIYANIDGAPRDDPRELAKALSAQVCSPVRFSSAVSLLKDSGHLFVELGGRVLASMVKKSIKDAKIISVTEPAGVDLALEAMGE